MASFNFNIGIRNVVTGAIDLDTDTFKMLLTTGTVLGATEKDTFDYRNDITTEHANGSGYTTGGAAVTLTVAAVDGTNDDIEVTASAVSWTSATITATGAVIYKSRGGASSADELLCYIDFGGTVSSTNGTFTVTPTGSLKFQN
jgi:hypothetical protein